MRQIIFDLIYKIIDYDYFKKVNVIKYYDIVCIRHDGIGDQLIWDKYLEIINKKKLKVLLISPPITTDYLIDRYKNFDIITIAYKKYSLNIIYILKINKILRTTKSNYILLPCFPNKNHFHYAIARIIGGILVESKEIKIIKLKNNINSFEHENHRYDRLLMELFK
jgi:hypothetical protein